MRKKRVVTITIGKRDDEGMDREGNEAAFGQNVEAILRLAEQAATKVFIGICIYVVLDTHRKVATVRAFKPHG